MQGRARGTAVAVIVSGPRSVPEPGWVAAWIVGGDQMVSEPPPLFTWGLSEDRTARKRPVVGSKSIAHRSITTPLQTKGVTWTRWPSGSVMSMGVNCVTDVSSRQLGAMLVASHSSPDPAMMIRLLLTLAKTPTSHWLKGKSISWIFANACGFETSRLAT